MSSAFIEQNIGGIAEPMLTVRPRYVKDQLSGLRGRRSRFRIISPTTSSNNKATGLGLTLKKELEYSGKGFTSMLITDVNYSFTEKTQIDQTFGDSITVYAFGASPVVLNISGVVVDDLDNNWFVKLIYVYQDFLRATKLAKNYEIARLDMPDASYIGSIMSLGVVKNSGNDALVSFNMQFLVRNYQFYSTQSYDTSSLSKEKPIEDVAKDGSFSYKTLKDAKNIKQVVGQAVLGKVDSAASNAFSSIALGAGDFINKKFVNSNPTSAFGMFTNLAISKVSQKASSSLGSALDKQYNRLKDSLKVDQILGLGLKKSVVDEADKASRPYSLRVIGVYSRLLAEAGDENAVSDFLSSPNANEGNALTNEAIRRILSEGSFETERDLKKKELTNTVKIGKKILDLAQGKRSLNIDSIGELGQVGKSIAGTLGKVAALPTTAADLAGKLVNMTPLSKLPIVGSLAGGIAADQAEKYFRKKIPKEASTFLKIPSQEPSSQRIVRVALGE